MNTITKSIALDEEKNTLVMVEHLKHLLFNAPLLRVHGERDSARGEQEGEATRGYSRQLCTQPRRRDTRGRRVAAVSFASRGLLRLTTRGYPLLTARCPRFITADSSAIVLLRTLAPWKVYVICELF